MHAQTAETQQPQAAPQIQPDPAANQVAQIAVQPGLGARVNNGLTAILKAYPVPISIAGTVAGVAIYETVAKPLGGKAVTYGRKAVTYVFAGGQAAVVEDVGGEVAKQALSAGGRGLGMYARALPRVIIEDAGVGLVKETGKNLLGGAGGGVWRVLANLMAALAK